MKTNKNITFAALNSHYLDTSDMSINSSYLCEALELWGMNTERFYNKLKNKRVKIHSLVWAILTDLTNDHIKTNEYPYHQDYYASSDQLKNWLTEYGQGYKTLEAAIQYFEAEHAELLEG